MDPSSLPPDPLRASALFRDLTPEAAEALAAEAHERTLSPGEVVFQEGSAPACVLVLEGALEAVERDAQGKEQPVRTIEPGEAVDELQVLAGAARPVEVRAGGPARIAHVHGPTMRRLKEAHPDLAAAMERLHRRQLLCRLHPFLGAFDHAFLDEVETMADWVSLRRGDTIPQGAESVVYLVISGRVQSVAEENGQVRVLAEAGRGETIGELAFVDAAPGQRVRAARDSVLVGFSAEEFERLVARRPAILRHVARYLVAKRGRTHRKGWVGTSVTNVAVVPVRPGVPAGEFAERLVRALTPFGPTLHLSAERVNRRADEAGLTAATEGGAREPALLAWLEAQEAAHRFVVYEADADDTPWTRRCVRQADRVLLVARADDDPSPSPLEQALFAAPDVGTHEVLVLLHPDGERVPSGTRARLDARPRVEEHFHVRWDRDADVERLARKLAGRAIGLVLGGGGARGFAHIGILRALEEAGIPVDAVGGTSMGAAVAAQRALEWSPERIAQASRRVFVEIQPHKRLTFPLVSIVTNAQAMECGRMLYGEADIEDCWIPFFCVSSNLSTATPMVHRRGAVAKATLASASLPAFAPPIVEGNHLLVDGGLLNNVPVDVMRALGCGTVIASQVSSEEDEAFLADRVPTAWEVLSGRFRRGPRLRFPSLFEVAMRSTMLYSIGTARTAMEEADLPLFPPVKDYSMMDFEKIDEIADVGYAYARAVLKVWTDRTDAVPASATT
ncbi:MAG TPA: cyclic nucleotide-binding and patatin-like phospholipase domain-containing protein [Rubricoccaceae bacterium]|nr:cyclic nucleotide-binding and patatin-like phospholipase domain-containing protein [Rubricoccaceae bacterium]